MAKHAQDELLHVNDEGRLLNELGHHIFLQPLGHKLLATYKCSSSDNMVGVADRIHGPNVLTKHQAYHGPGCSRIQLGCEPEVRRLDFDTTRTHSELASREDFCDGRLEIKAKSDEMHKLVFREPTKPNLPKGCKQLLLHDRTLKLRIF